MYINVHVDNVVDGTFPTCPSLFFQVDCMVYFAIANIARSVLFPLLGICNPLSSLLGIHLQSRVERIVRSRTVGVN